MSALPTLPRTAGILARLRDDLAPWVRRTPAGSRSGEPEWEQFHGRNTVRVNGIAAKTSTFVDVCLDDTVLGVADHRLIPDGGATQISDTQLIAIGPGEPAQYHLPGGPEITVIAMVAAPPTSGVRSSTSATCSAGCDPRRRTRSPCRPPSAPRCPAGHRNSSGSPSTTRPRARGVASGSSTSRTPPTCSTTTCSTIPISPSLPEPPAKGHRHDCTRHHHEPQRGRHPSAATGRTHLHQRGRLRDRSGLPPRHRSAALRHLPAARVRRTPRDDPRLLPVGDRPRPARRHRRRDRDRHVARQLRLGCAARLRRRGLSTG